MAVKYPVVCREKSSGRQIAIFVKSCRRSLGLGYSVQKTEDYHGFLICVQTLGRLLFGKMNDDGEQ